MPSGISNNKSRVVPLSKGSSVLKNTPRRDTFVDSTRSSPPPDHLILKRTEVFTIYLLAKRRSLPANSMNRSMVFSRGAEKGKPQKSVTGDEQFPFLFNIIKDSIPYWVHSTLNAPQSLVLELSNKKSAGLVACGFFSASNDYLSS